VLEHLNMFDVLSVDRVVSRLYSKHPAGSTEGSITWIGSKFENFRIAGYPVEIELDMSLLDKLHTFEAAKKTFDKDAKFRKIAENPLPGVQSLTKLGDNGVILCSIVKKIETDYPGVEPRGQHGFYVKGFGSVYLGELLIKHGEKTLTMLRFELGSTSDGSGTAGGTKTNGRPYP